MNQTASGSCGRAQRSWQLGAALFLTWVLSGGLTPTFAGQEVASFSIIGRPAKDMLPVVRKFLAPEGVAEAHNDKLIVRTTSSNMQEIREILGQLDRKPRILRIRVRAPGGIQSRSTSARIGATVPIAGKRGVILINPGQTTALKDSETTSQSVGGQEILVEEGQDGFIHTSDGGFYVRPVVHGEKVRLDVLTHSTAVGSGRVESGAKIVAPIGKWTSVSGVSSSRKDQSSGIGKKAAGRTTAEQAIELQVTEVMK